MGLKVEFLGGFGFLLMCKFVCHIQLIRPCWFNGWIYAQLPKALEIGVTFTTNMNQVGPSHGSISNWALFESMHKHPQQTMGLKICFFWFWVPHVFNLSHAN